MSCPSPLRSNTTPSFRGRSCCSSLRGPPQRGRIARGSTDEVCPCRWSPRRQTPSRLLFAVYRSSYRLTAALVRPQDLVLFVIMVASALVNVLIPFMHRICPPIH